MAEETKKPILCLDFDGVIHDYKEGWKDGSIYGNVTPGFFEWAYEAGKYFRLVVYSSRSKDSDKLYEMRKWLYDRQSDWQMTKNAAQLLMTGTANDYFLDFEFAHEKPPAFLTIDDRAIRFEGKWNSADLVPSILRDFKSWNAK